MKTKAWLLFAVGGCILVMVCWSGSAQSLDASLQSRGSYSTLFPHEYRGDQAALRCSNNLTFARKDGAYSMPCGRKATPLIRALDRQPDDDGQADDNSDDYQEMKLSCSEMCHCPAEWRLIQPDTQFASSFINTKAKPPP